MSEAPRAKELLLDELAALGTEIADLVLAAVTARSVGPTVADYLTTIAPTFTPGTAATYAPYWRLTTAHLGDRRLSEVTVVDLQAVVADAAVRARSRRPGASGRASRETCVAALRALFSRARAAGLIRTDPAALLTKPRRARSRRRALDDTELAELIGAVRATSNDPDLDLLVVRFHLESGARRQGALNLRHARSRGATRPADRVLRSRTGRPMTARRYDRLFSRARRCLEWADRTPISAHVLRHTAINAVGRYGGYPIAQAFAGHTPPSVTGRYMQASIEEVAAVVAALTGEAHPLDRTGAHDPARCRRPRCPRS